MTEETRLPAPALTGGGALDLTPATLPADQNPALVYLARLAPGSRPTQARALSGMAEILSGGTMPAGAFPWHALRYQHTAAVRGAIAARYAPATGRRWLTALKGVLREAWRLHLMEAEDYQRAIDLAPIRGSRTMTGRALPADQVADLFRDCADGTPAGARDAALLALLYGCGLRRAEAVAVDLADLDLAAGTLRVVGKGNKERELPLVNGTLEALTAWHAVRGDAPGPFLVPVLRWGRVTPRRMTPQAVLYVLRHRGARAGVPAFTPHDCRRSFVSDLLDTGADLVTVSTLAGHSNPKTTARYDRRGEAARRRAAAGLTVPFVARKQHPA